MQEETGLEITVISNYGWEMDIRVVAANENFRGYIELETNPDWLADLAAKFQGYSKSHEDRFRVEVGVENYRYVVIEAFCTDAAGHAALAVTMTEDSPVLSGSVPSQEARIVIPFEPAAAGEFAAALKQIAARKSDRAQLASFR